MFDAVAAAMFDHVTGIQIMLRCSEHRGNYVIIMVVFVNNDDVLVELAIIKHKHNIRNITYTL